MSKGYLMKQIPTSSLSEIFCLKSKDKVLADVNLLIRFFFKSAKATVTKIRYMKRI